MQFDFAHAIVAAVLIAGTVWLIKRGDAKDAPKRKWDWRIFIAVFIVIFILNTVWPYDS